MFLVQDGQKRPLPKLCDFADDVDHELHQGPGDEETRRLPEGLLQPATGRAMGHASCSVFNVSGDSLQRAE